MRAALQRLNRAMEAKPLLTSVLVTGAKAVAADVMVQRLVENKDWRLLDQKRVLLFGVFGLTYQGGFQYWLINYGWERLFPGRGWRATLKKVCSMNLIGMCYTIATPVLHRRYYTVTTPLLLHHGHTLAKPLPNHTSASQFSSTSPVHRSAPREANGCGSQETPYSSSPPSTHSRKSS